MELDKDKIEQLREKYRVNPNSEEFKAILEDARKMVFRNKEPVGDLELSTVVLVGGQQGSGKNQLMLLDTRDSDNVVRLLLDELTPFHPKKDEILESYPDLYAYLTYEFGLALRNTLYDEAIQNRYNIRTEGTLKDTPGTVKLIEEAREQGYRVEVDVMATGIVESSLSVFERYEKEIEGQKKGEDKIPRLVEWNFTYDDIPKTVKEIEGACLVDSIKIFERGIDEYNSNLKYATNANRNDYRNAYDCITTVRKLDNIRAKRRFRERFNILRGKMINRNATNRERIQLTKLPKDLKERHQIDVDDEKEI